jgi:hypothetical protein
MQREKAIAVLADAQIHGTSSRQATQNYFPL